MIILFWVFFLALAWCLGALIQNAHLWSYYLKHINEPWKQAIEREDWDECDRIKVYAQYYSDQYNWYVPNPLKWFRVPRLPE